MSTREALRELSRSIWWNALMALTNLAFLAYAVFAADHAVWAALLGLSSGWAVDDFMKSVDEWAKS